MPLRAALTAILVLWAAQAQAQAQAVDKEAVRARLAERGFTCADVRKAPRWKLLLWAVEHGLNADQRRQVKVVCGVK